MERKNEKKKEIENKMGIELEYESLQLQYVVHFGLFFCWKVCNIN